MEPRGVVIWGRLELGVFCCMSGAPFDSLLFEVSPLPGTTGALKVVCPVSSGPAADVACGSFEGSKAHPAIVAATEQAAISAFMPDVPAERLFEALLSFIILISNSIYALPRPLRRLLCAWPAPLAGAAIRAVNKHLAAIRIHVHIALIECDFIGCRAAQAHQPGLLQKRGAGRAIQCYPGSVIGGDGVAVRSGWASTVGALLLSRRAWTIKLRCGRSL